MNVRMDECLYEYMHGTTMYACMHAAHRYSVAEPDEDQRSHKNGETETRTYWGMMAQW